jgi:hypothetical protein
VSNARRPALRSLALATLTAALSFVLAAPASAAPKFGTAPALPSLPAVTLNGGAQTANATMSNFTVEEGIESGGWNVTVAGQSGTKKSAVFARYCPKAKCGSDSEGYVAGGATLPGNSLTLNTTGASFTGGVGTAPAFQCSSACNVDSASAVKIASKATGGFGGSTWKTSGFSATSLALSTPSTMRVLPAEEVYRVNVVWTLSTGP